MSRTISSSASLSLKMRNAFSGSPTYTGRLNFVVFTRPPRSRSKHGMTRCLSTSELHEVLHQRHAEAMALLRMELHAENIVTGESGNKVVTVTRGRGHVLCIATGDVIRMHEVESLYAARVRNQRIRSC